MSWTILWVENNQDRWERTNKAMAQVLIQQLAENPNVSLEDVLVIPPSHEEMDGEQFLEIARGDILPVTYTSVWNQSADTVTTKAKLNKRTGEVFDIQGSDTDIDGTLDREFITLSDGREIDILKNDDGEAFIDVSVLN